MENGAGGEVFALVCLVRRNPKSTDGHAFGYKDMSESMGPWEDGCPAKILDLLTPTTSEYALDWRALPGEVREALAQDPRRHAHQTRARAHVYQRLRR